MSKIYFHHQEDGPLVKVAGPERHHAAWLCRSLFMVALGVDNDVWGINENHVKAMRSILPPESYLHQIRDDHKFAHSFTSWAGGLHDDDIMIEGERFSVFDIVLNTTYVAGSDPIRLLARLHGQCEIHAYVEGHNRAWLADIIERGRQIGVMRDNMGWESVITLLRSQDDSPIVTSYSVTEGFPNYALAMQGGFEIAEDEETGELDTDTFYDLSGQEQWDLAIKGLREKDRGLELTPKTWENYFFGASRLNGFQVSAIALENVDKKSQPG